MFTIATFLLFINTGPLNAAIINVVLPERRATAVAMNILIIHILGDALSPLLIGRISDQYGLVLATKIMSIATLLAAFILIVGSKHLEKDEAAVGQQVATPEKG